MLHQHFTVAAVPSADGSFKIGIAICSAKDNFSKKVGRELSFKRATEDPFAEVRIVGDDAYTKAMNAMAIFEASCQNHTMSLKRILNDMKQLVKSKEEKPEKIISAPATEE